MVECPDCGFEAKSAAGLSSHRRGKHADAMEGRPNVAAVEQTLTELERMGRLEKVDAARVQAVRSMAVALDINPFNSQMWREYREALEGLTADGNDEDGLAELLAELSGSSVRDP